VPKSLFRAARAFWLVSLIFAGCGKSSRNTPPEKASIRLPESKEDRAAWRNVLHWSDDCEEAFRGTGGSRGGLQFYDLDHNRQLVEVGCAAGAYQGSQEYFIVDQNPSSEAVHAVSLPTYEASGTDGETLLRKSVKEITGSPEFDHVNHRLKILNRYRGPGDCGSYAVYGFQSEQPVLEEFRAKLECDGTGAEHPEQWPVRH